MVDTVEFVARLEAYTDKAIAVRINFRDKWIPLKVIKQMTATNSYKEFTFKVVKKWAQKNYLLPGIYDTK